MKAALALADGTVFWGRSFGADRAIEKAAIGEVVFNTSMYGYQEILTDPSYAGQIMTFTYPHIGNVGCNALDVESERIHVEGLVIRRASLRPANFRSELSLSDYLRKANILGLEGIDTRTLVLHIRNHGAQMGAMASGDKLNSSDLVDKARAAGSMLGKEFVSSVTCKKTYEFSEGLWELASNSYLAPKLTAEAPHVVALDCGIKKNILRIFNGLGCRVTVVPAFTSASEILTLSPNAVFLSNGPGDPATLKPIVANVQELIGKLPIFGICLGHQILAQAFGAKTFKLKFGHRGGNHPVKDLRTQKVEISVQNHGFAVEENSWSKDAKLSHINLNDGTVEGLEMPEHKAFCIQYHPEASPGPHDSNYLFNSFYDLIKK